MLVHGARPSQLVGTAARATKGHLLARHLVRRQFSAGNARNSNAGHVERIKNDLRIINASPYWSVQYKHRNSVRLFAEHDYFASAVELEGLHGQYPELSRKLDEPMVVQRYREGLADPVLTRAAICYRKEPEIYDKMSALQWEVLRLNVFAAWGDVSVLARLVRLLLFPVHLAFYTIMYWLKRRDERKMTRWLP